MGDNSTDPYTRQAGSGDKARAIAARNERALSRSKTGAPWAERASHTSIGTKLN